MCCYRRDALAWAVYETTGSLVNPDNCSGAISAAAIGGGRPWLAGEHGRPGDGPGGCSRVVTCARILILTRFGRAEYVHQHSRLKRAGSCSTTIFLGSSSQTRTRWWIP